MTALCLCALALRSGQARAAPRNHGNGSAGSSSADNSADAQALQKQIDALVGTPPIARGRVSIEVRSLDTGKLIYARDPNALLNPASNTKIATAAAALLRLGPEYKFTTDVLTDKSFAHGKAKQLFIKGRGDPSITTERLDGIVRDLAHRGLTEVDELVLDDTHFDRETWGPGWETETSDKAYASGVGALSLNRNSVGIYVVPGAKAGAKAIVTLDPDAKGFFELENQVQTTKPSSRNRALPHTYALNEKTRVTVSGRIGVGGDPIIMYRRITDPTFYFGYTLKQILQQHGVKVLGVVKRGVAPQDAKFVSSYDSYELGEIVRDMNKASSNHIAEMLFKNLGAEAAGEPGTWAKGTAAVEDALAELGLPKRSYQLKNGSGLNDTNRFSSHQMVTLLTTLHARFPLSAEFMASLPVAARDGTLRLRMDGTEAAGRMRAKTGTLDRAVALSGYLQTHSGEQLAFSFIANDWNGRTSSIVQDADKLGVMLASLGQKPNELKAELQNALAQQLPPEEQAIRLRSYAVLAQAKDKKNLAALKRAVHMEHDPLVRLMAADALYRTDSESGTGPLLEALGPAPGHELFDKLRIAVSPLKLPVPVLASLFDMAAEGNADALSRLLALCPAAAGALPDPALELLLAGGLADAAEASPDEMFNAMKSAPVDQARACSFLIGKGFADDKTEMDDSQFAQVVLAASARAEPEAVEARLWVKLIERRGLKVPSDTLTESSSTAAPAVR